MYSLAKTRCFTGTTRIKVRVKLNCAPFSVELAVLQFLVLNHSLYIKMDDVTAPLK